MKENGASGSERKYTNLVANHDFSRGLSSWKPTHSRSHFHVASGSQGSYAVVSKRQKWWEGLEQDITTKVSVGFTYKVSAWVGVCSYPQPYADVKATLKLKYQHLDTQCYLTIGRYITLLKLT